MNSGAPPVQPPPNYSLFQQTMASFKPRSNPLWLVVTYLICFIIFIVFGTVAFASNSNMFHEEIEYNTTGGPFTVTVSEDIDEPVYLYYKLTNFYVNHRRFSSSRSDKQLKGNSISDDALKDCDPLYDDGKIETEPFPCGLMAAARFTDTVTLSLNGATLESTTEDLVSSAEKKLYKQSDPSFDVTEPHFMSWMRPQPFSSFVKALQIYKSGLKKGNYTLTVTGESPELYKPSSTGKKYLVLATDTWLKKKSNFLAIFLVIVASVCLFVACFYILIMYWDRRLRSEYLSRHHLKVVNKSS